MDLVIMEIIKFKTNVESREALAKIAPFLDKEEGISRWNIDTESAERVLSVSGTDLSAGAIERAVEQAGYKTEIIRVIGLSGGDL